jgi:plastocyanin
VTTQRTNRWLGLLSALFLAAAALLLAAAPADASIRTVVLDATGPTPSTLTIAKGDIVNFFNNDSVNHKITHTVGSWTFTADIKANTGVATKPFTASGTYKYDDDFVIVAVPRKVEGTIVVQASTPSPSPSPTRAPTPRPTTSPTARPTVGPSATASPTPGPTGSGTAIGPGIGPGSTPSATPSPTGPPPSLASPGASPVPGVSYSGRGLIQGSPHGWGLPVVLALVGIAGVVSLLVRLLLAEPAARRRRTGDVAGFEG